MGFLAQCLVVPDGECHARNKISEIVHLLYNTACSVKLWAPETTDSNSPGTSNGSSGGVAAALLNPTVGVRQRFVPIFCLFLHCF